MHIKIVTINTWKCDGNYRLRLKALANQLKMLRPEVIACQECFSSNQGQLSTLDFLGSELQMNYQFVESRFKKRWFENQWVESYSGLGILSVYSFIKSSAFDLPGDNEDPERRIQRVLINLPNEKKLLITNTHLTHISRTPLRKIQLDHLAETISSCHDHDYHILCGDFNIPIDSEDFADFMNAAGAVDCYHAGSGEEPRYSMVNEFMHGRMLCLDHILALPPVTGQYKFVNSQVVLNSLDEQTCLYGSDHFGITTTLIAE
jgi:endonuclease/exonuclease/phosphatase family metal-dependent hydrolase